MDFATESIMIDLYFVLSVSSTVDMCYYYYRNQSVCLPACSPVCSSVCLTSEAEPCFIAYASLNMWSLCSRLLCVAITHGHHSRQEVRLIRGICTQAPYRRGQLFLAQYDWEGPVSRKATWLQHRLCHQQVILKEKLLQSVAISY